MNLVTDARRVQPANMTGLRVTFTTGALAIETRRVLVRRSWWARLLTRPWRPWQSHRWVTRDEAVPAAYIVGNQLYVHPALRENFETMVRLANARAAAVRNPGGTGAD